MSGGKSRLTLIVLVVALAGCGDGGGDDDAQAERSQTAPFERTVSIADKRYSPARARILVGGSITWVNRDPDAGHTAESDAPDVEPEPWLEKTDFDTHTLTWREPYTVTFHKPGTYEYHCSFHDMKGVVEVVQRFPLSARP